MEKIDQPLNAQERYLYAINLRLDAVINILSSLVEVYAREKGLAVTQNKVEEIVEGEPETIAEEVVEKPKRTRKK